MSTHIYLGIKTEKGPVKQCQLLNYDLENSVKHLKEEVSKQNNLPSDNLEIIYHGHILEDEKSLKEYGVKFGETINVFKKYVPSEPEVVPPITEADTQEFWALCRSLGLNIITSGTDFSYTMTFLSAMDSSLEAMPAIADNPVALNILRQPELLFRLLEPETFDAVAAKYPIIVRALNKIFSSLDIDNMASNGEGQNHASNFNRNWLAVECRSDSYLNMDTDDSDDEIEPTGSDDQRENGVRTNPVITSEQLSSALLFAHRPTPHSSPQSFSRSGRLLSDAASRSTSELSRMIITPDMFSNALSQALVSANTGESTSSAATSSPLPLSLNMDQAGGGGSSETEAALLRMREMGLTNARLNRRALIASGGNVNDAINLILCNAIEDDPHDPAF